MKNFYSIKEAADYLEVDYKVVYRLVREGKIPSGQPARGRRYPNRPSNTT